MFKKVTFLFLCLVCVGSSLGGGHPKQTTLPPHALDIANGSDHLPRGAAPAKPSLAECAQAFVDAQTLQGDEVVFDYDNRMDSVVSVVYNLDGQLRTMNQHGTALLTLDPTTTEFVKCASSKKGISGPALELGAAYGAVAFAAVANGAEACYINDLDERHLRLFQAAILGDNAITDLFSVDHGLPKVKAFLQQMNARNREEREALAARFPLAPGRFPDAIDFPENTFKAVLSARMFHFLDGPTIDRGLKKIFKWLKPGGQIFITAETSKLKGFESFQETFLERFNHNDLWPGEMEDMGLYARGRKGYRNFLDPRTLSWALTRAGFEEVKTNDIPREEDNFQQDLLLDGHESVGATGVKPRE